MQGLLWRRPHSLDDAAAVTLRSSLVRVGRTGTPAAGVSLACAAQTWHSWLDGCAAHAAQPRAAVHAQHGGRPLQITLKPASGGGVVMARRVCCAVARPVAELPVVSWRLLDAVWLLCLTSTDRGRLQLPVW